MALYYGLYSHHLKLRTRTNLAEKPRTLVVVGSPPFLRLFPAWFHDWEYKYQVSSQVLRLPSPTTPSHLQPYYILLDSTSPKSKHHLRNQDRPLTTNMPANATVLYPADADATFDLDYYLKTHMPLVQEKWGKYGLQGWSVVKYSPGPDGGKTYTYAALLTWDSPESIGKAMQGEETKEVLGDVQNFSNKGPVFLTGEIVGTS